MGQASGPPNCSLIWESEPRVEPIQASERTWMKRLRCSTRGVPSTSSSSWHMPRSSKRRSCTTRTTHLEMRERPISPNELLTWAEAATVATADHPHPWTDWNFSEKFPEMPFVYRRSAHQRCHWESSVLSVHLQELGAK